MIEILRGERRRRDLTARFLPAVEAIEEPHEPLDLDRLADCLTRLGERARTVVTMTFYAERDAAELLLEKGNAFIAVGALHLVGSTGLVAVLRARGYTVTAVE